MNENLHHLNHLNTGFLSLIIGPMFSSKTSRLLSIYKKCIFGNISVSIINHIIDKRYHDTMLSSHDNIMAPCIQTDNLKDVSKQLKSVDVILINEGQFFSDLYEVVLDMLNHNKKVYICGLDGDFEKKKFGQILDLIPHCDEVIKLKAMCSVCKNTTPGIFTMRLTDEKEQTVVGSNNYIPVCRNCYK